MSERVHVLEDGELFLRISSPESEMKTYDLLWVINNYDKIAVNKTYKCHDICVGSKLYQLFIERIKTNFPATSNKDRTRIDICMYLIPNLAESLQTAFAIIFSQAGVEREIICQCENARLGKVFKIEEEPFMIAETRLLIRWKILLTEEQYPSMKVRLPSDAMDEHLSEYMEELFLKAKFSDVKIVVARKEFPAHRAILAARSTVFASILEVNKKEDKIVIDYEPDIFLKFLSYVYTGKNKDPLTSELAIKLLSLAEKYNLNSLKRNCAKFLCYNLTVNCVIEVYQVAVECKESNLKFVALNFIASKLLSVMKESNWPSLRVSDEFIDSLLPLVGKLASRTCYQDYRPVISD